MGQFSMQEMAVLGSNFAANQQHQVVSAITRLAKTVSFRVIAEQVEDQADFDVLREIGVDFVRGYCIQRPEKL